MDVTKRSLLGGALASLLPAAAQKSTSLIVLLMILAPTHSLALDSRAIGAWSQAAADCATTFKRNGREIRFREPRDELKSAFIIGNDAITTTAGRCKILKASQKSDPTFPKWPAA